MRTTTIRASLAAIALAVPLAVQAQDVEVSLSGAVPVSDSASYEQASFTLGATSLHKSFLHQVVAGGEVTVLNPVGDGGIGERVDLTFLAGARIRLGPVFFQPQLGATYAVAGGDGNGFVLASRLAAGIDAMLGPVGIRLSGRDLHDAEEGAIEVGIFTRLGS